MELAIDGSSELIRLALSSEGVLQAELSWVTKQNHTVELLPGVASIFERVGADFRSLSAVFVARGPGSFNGLRAAISAAKGLALATGTPMVGISTLEIEAYPFGYAGLPLYPVHDAGRGEIAVATYLQNDGEWQCLEDGHITTLSELANTVVHPSLFCGELSNDMVAELKKTLGELAVIPDGVARSRHGAELCTLGWRRLQAGDRDDMATLQPLYLRRPHISQLKPR
jgi:tRNA threonylcarbamoyladenosine biosynthesis protein TsaB